MVDVSKRDWKLFREKLPGWQESYMERLCKEYVELLTCEKKGSERFWALEERIKKDRKAPGVILSVSKSDMLIGRAYQKRSQSSWRYFICQQIRYADRSRSVGSG